MYFSCERKKNSCAFNKEIRMVRRACILAIWQKGKSICRKNIEWRDVHKFFFEQTNDY